MIMWISLTVLICVILFAEIIQHNKTNRRNRKALKHVNEIAQTLEHGVKNTSSAYVQKAMMSNTMRLRLNGHVKK
jgi:hypothetical protein